jgi:hypothetical protein
MSKTLVMRSTSSAVVPLSDLCLLLSAGANTPLYLSRCLTLCQQRSTSPVYVFRVPASSDRRACSILGSTLVLLTPCCNSRRLSTVRQASRRGVTPALTISRGRPWAVSKVATDRSRGLIKQATHSAVSAQDRYIWCRPLRLCLWLNRLIHAYCLA